MILFVSNCPAEVSNSVLTFGISHPTNYCALIADRFHRSVSHKEKAILCDYRNQQASLGFSKHHHNYTTPIRMKYLSLWVLKQITWELLKADNLFNSTILDLYNQNQSPLVRASPSLEYQRLWGSSPVVQAILNPFVQVSFPLVHSCMHTVNCIFSVMLMCTVNQVSLWWNKPFLQLTDTKRSGLFPFFSQHSLFIFLCQVVFSPFGALTWLSSSSSRSKGRSRQRQELRVGRRWEQSPTLMAASARSSSSGAGDFTLRYSLWVCFLILFHLVVHLTWGVRSVPGSLLGFVSFSLYFTRCKKEPGLKELT